MLVLTRRIGEEILIGDDIVLKFLGWQGTQARIGISAPKDRHIVRTEIASLDEINQVYKNAGMDAGEIDSDDLGNNKHNKNLNKWDREGIVK